MAGNILKEEGESFMFFDSQFNHTLYSNAVLVGGESKKRRRRKKNKEGGGDARKRKLTAEQVNSLEYNFSIDHNLETERKVRIAAELGLEPQQVAIWFQNRRVRYRFKKLEMEYFTLKTAHEGVTVEKSLLEQEVIRLKAQLSEAEKEMKRLEERSNEGSTSSQDSSFFSIDLDTFNLGEYPMEEGYVYDNLFQYENGLDWANYGQDF